MPSALIILLVTVAGGAAGESGSMGDPHGPGVVRAAREALGAHAQIVSEVVATDPSDAELLRLGEQVDADVVVEVTWSLPDHLHTAIRLERASTGQWVERNIDFRPVDDPAERSRAVGLTIALMLPEYAERAEKEAPAKPPPRTATARRRRCRCRHACGEGTAGATLERAHGLGHGRDRPR